MVWIPKTTEEAYLRAAGRRRYHAERRAAQRERQLLVMAALAECNFHTFGLGRRLALELSVDPATISRDIGYLVEFRLRLAIEYGPQLADSIFRRFAAIQKHPRDGYVIRLVNGALQYVE